MSDKISGLVWLLVAYLLIMVAGLIVGKRNETFKTEMKKTLLTIGGIFLIVGFFVLFIF